MRHDLGQKGLGLLGIERHVKAQPTATIMGLTGAASAQIAPDAGRRQRRVVSTGLLQALFHMRYKACLAGIARGKVTDVTGRKIGHE
ncbi:hypothetical protein GCM10010082_03500 [Kushneria pakistanensis]|uniref:Uncharacterized protein n=1 Tax=Kushneria pakistanensis TaxID=1508770 RepID=A0ABQ3FAN7_9GAMM|nr:hypothetical protein GCM10010082_03500 [Kushneria pakistanensis]